MSKGDAVVVYREPLAIRRRFVSYGGTCAEDGVAQLSRRLNKMGLKMDIYNSP
jgi:hypothetical protein